MRILMLNYEFPPLGGGGGRAHLCLLKEYSGREELQIDVLTSAAGSGISVEQFAGNIIIYKVGVHKKDMHYWRKMEVIEWLLKAGSHYRRLLRASKYDFAHAFFGFPTGWLCYRSAKVLPYIISLRGSDVPGRHGRLSIDYKILGPVFKAIWKKAAMVVACSEGLKQRAMRFMPSACIQVIPNGVLLDRFYPSEAKQRRKVLKLITVGRLSVTKRVQMLIGAVELLRGEGYEIHLAVAGGGGMERQLKQIVSERRLGDVVEIMGLVPAERIPQLYQDSNIFVSASMQEGMSNAMLEAMASGLPIITTQCEGVEELIADNGIVLEQAGAESMAEAIKRLARDEELYQAMCIAARSRAERFSWESTASQYLEIYRKIMGNK